MAKLKKITYDVVKEVAESLIASNTTTTTLDVKEELRTRGYIANQSEVSSMMDKVSSDCNFSIDNSNGTYRIFSTSLSSGNSSLTALLNTSKTLKTKKPSAVAISIKSKDLKPITNPKQRDWEVSSISCQHILYFDGYNKRDTVRYTFARTHNVHFHSTRSRRVR